MNTAKSVLLIVIHYLYCNGNPSSCSHQSNLMPLLERIYKTSEWKKKGAFCYNAFYFVSPYYLPKELIQIGVLFTMNNFKYV